MAGHLQVLAHAPVFSDGAVSDAEEVMVYDRHAAPGRRDAGEDAAEYKRHRGHRAVRSGEPHPGSDEFAVADQFLNVVPFVGEDLGQGGEDPGDPAPLAGRPLLMASPANWAAASACRPVALLHRS